MLSQVMLVGVGGSGGKTLRVLRQTLLRRLRQVGWEGTDLPDAWQMLWIDSVSTQVADGFPEKLLPPDSYLGLVSPGVNWAGNKQALINSLPVHSRQTALSSWIPSTVPFEISKGAGQYRAVGRGVALNQLDSIVHKLRAQYQLMTAPKALQELRGIARLLGVEAESNPPSPFALVVSSIAGGSGAGMFLDVAEALKAVGPSFAANTHTIIYGPDVFGNLPKGMNDGVAPNVLAAVHEMISCVRKDNMDPGSQKLFEVKSVQIPTDGYGVGGKYNYLMGARNGHVAFGTQEEVYRAVGEALAPLVIDDAVQDWLNSFLITNVFASTGNVNTIADQTGLRDTGNIQHRQPLSSLGFARVGLGMDRFSEYAAEVLARESVTQLLWPRGVPIDPREPKTKTELITERVENTWAEFLSRSGLNERDPANDVVDALVPADSQARFQAAATAMVARAAQGVGPKGLDPTTWAQRLLWDYNNTLPQILGQENEARFQASREWARTIQDRLVRQVTEIAGTHGLQVAARLVEKLRDEVKFVANSELVTEASTKRRYLIDLPGSVSQVLNSGITAIAPDHPSIDDARGALVMGMVLNADAERLDLAAAILLDLEANLLVVMQRALSESASALEQDIAALTADGSASPYESWPEMAGEVPQRLLPGVTEKVLIEASTYPQLLEQLARQSVGQSSTDAWRQRLISRTISGLALDERALSQHPTLLTAEPAWIPQNDRVRWEQGMGAQRASISIPTRAPLFVDRALDSILNDSSTILGRFLRQDLEEYLSTPDVADRARREAVFSSALNSAVDASKPMADLNANLLPLVHPGQVASSYVTSSVIPASLRRLVEPVLETKGVNAANAKIHYGDVKPQQIEFFQVLQKAYHPMVFQTLMTPIRESWLKVQGDGALREAWWRMRRARPLTEALPVTEDVLQLMVTGWFVGGFLNQRSSDNETPALGPKVRVADLDGTWLDFPHPILGLFASSNDHEILPGLLKSLGLAMTHAAATASLEPFKPYWRLRDLGAQHRELLANWVRDGVAPSKAAEPDPRVAGEPRSDVDGRKVTLMQSIALTTDHFEKLFAGVEASPADLDADRIWELRDQVRVALSDIRESVQNLQAPPTAGVVT